MLKEVEVKRVLIVTGRTDMRRGINGLTAIIKDLYQMDTTEEGSLFLFCGRKKNTIKGLIFEGDGYAMVTKVLNRGYYSWPNTPSELKSITLEDYHRLIDGFSIKNTIHGC